MESDTTLSLQPPKKISVIIPCYNEEKTIAQVIDEVFSVLPNAHIYVFDNNSSDNSRSIVKAKIDEIKSLDCHIERSEISNMESKKDFSCLHTQNDKIGESSNFTQKAPHSPIKAENLDSTSTNHVGKTTNSSDCSVALEALSELEGRSYLSDMTTHHNSLNRSNCIDKGEFLQNLDSKTPAKSLTLYSVSTQGKGAVMREAFALIEADFYIMIDADTEHDASILPQALAYFSTHKLDMLNIAREADSSTYRKGHSFGNKLFSKSTQMLFGTKINDMLSGYRIFSRPFVKSFPAHSNGFEIETELTIYALEQRLRTDEIKAPYKSRPEGSFSKLSTFKDGFKISLMILNLLFSERPLLVFSVLSAICFLLSLFFGVPVFVEFLETSKVARFPTLFVCVGLMVIAVVLFIAGLLAHLVTKSIKESRYLAYLQSSREANKGIYG
ncbi:glycosyltransferase [Helicobacter bilis]|uniref:Glycosyltransferase n=2 Tax=Helicobacter bilis TaxID=37372 RepID=A0A4U8U9W3_9HELI|nr:glycosyltransferase [Helicobacter bilis]TLE08781.1 glycosyltransferase [Helicobacter bilis]TLE10774.1 glycosyltransferase [Helicobacter bilis]